MRVNIIRGAPSPSTPLFPRDKSGYFWSPPAVNLNSSPRKERNNRENDYKSPNCANVFLFYSQTYKFVLKSVFCGFYKRYRICFEKWLFLMPRSMEADLQANNNTMNYSRNFTVSIWKSYPYVLGELMKIFAAARGLATPKTNTWLC